MKSSVVSSDRRMKVKKSSKLKSWPQGRPGTKVDVLPQAPVGTDFETRLIQSFYDAGTIYCRKGGKHVNSGTSMEELLVAFGTATFISGEFICQRVCQHVLRQRLTCIFHLRDVFECYKIKYTHTWTGVSTRCQRLHVHMYNCVTNSPG